MIKGVKIRIYPTKEQESKFWEHIGSCRYIWNYMLEIQNIRYENKEQRLFSVGMIRLLTTIKNDGEHDWLYNVSNASLQHVCKDLDRSFRLFFENKKGRPKMKSKKKCRPSYPVRCDDMYFQNGSVNISKVGKVKYKTDLPVPNGKGCKFKNPHISYKTGKWYLSFGVECESQMLDLTDKPVGVDLGVKEFAVVAYGEEKIVFHNINKSKKVKSLTKKLKHLQRSVSRKYEENRIGNAYIKTNNIKKYEGKIRKIYERITNIRHNYVHQTTSKIISLRPNRVVIEDLDLNRLKRNKYMYRIISEQNFYEFSRQMQYKCEWNNIPFVKADRYYPSSKTCSCCGNVKDVLKISERTFICPNCGFKIDRDFNAAINLSRYKD